ncbi:hypothetical protein RCCGEPOP_17193 [Rhizobium sp. Pop5]|nr:hypothetical protein RCCGEPOP_17193 [Rhizobium sp. Pop5]
MRKLLSVIIDELVKEVLMDHSVRDLTYFTAAWAEWRVLQCSVYRILAFASQYKIIARQIILD